MQFTISAYDEEGKCKICRVHASQFHEDGCELGEAQKELNRLSLRLEGRMAGASDVLPQGWYWRCPRCDSKNGKGYGSCWNCKGGRPT